MSSSAIFYLTCSIIGVIAVLTLMTLRSKNLRTINTAPSVLTSLGIFGTFLGITIGLTGFDPANASGTIPHLFEGIRLAFWTSVAGILGSLLVKFRFLIRPGLLTGAEIARRDNRALMEELVLAMRGVEQSLADEKASPLYSRIDEVRKATDTHHEQLQSAMTDISSVLKDSASRDSSVLSAIESMGQGTSAALAEVREGTQAAISEVRQGTEAAISKVTEGTQTALAQVREGSDAALIELRKGSDATLHEVRKGSDEALAAVRHDNKQVAELLQASSGQALEELGKQSASGLATLAEQSERQLAGVAAQLGESQQALVAGLQAAFLDELKQLRENSSNQLGSLNTTVSQLHDAFSAGDANANLIDRLDALATAQEKLGESIGNTVTSGIGKAAGEFRAAVSGPDGAVAVLSKEIRAGQQDVAAAVGSATENMQSLAGRDSAAALERIDNLGAGIQSLIEQVSGGFGDISAGLSGDADSLATRIMDTIDDLRFALVGTEAGKDGVVAEFRSSQQETSKALEAIRSSLAESDGSKNVVAELRKFQKDTVASLAGLGTALSGFDSGAAGIVEELRNAKEESRESLKAISKAIAENTRKQQTSPKALMTALEETVKQFNTQFSGQFWDKFGSFNSSIGELIEWMDTYRKQIADLLDHQTQAATNMDIAARRFDDVGSRAEIFVDVASSLSSLLGGLDSQRVQLESHLKRFAHIVDETSGSLENIENRIVGGNEEMNRHMREISERIEEQIIRLDHALDDELTKAMNTFGSQLAALSEKFVDDYTPLTERLRDVVNLAKVA